MRWQLFSSTLSIDRQRHTCAIAIFISTPFAINHFLITT
jgi:hypothetical protein